MPDDQNAPAAALLPTEVAPKETPVIETAAAPVSAPAPVIAPPAEEAPTAADFAKLTNQQQKDVLRELARIRGETPGESKRTLFPGESKRNRPQKPAPVVAKEAPAPVEKPAEVPVETAPVETPAEKPPVEEKPVVAPKPKDAPEGEESEDDKKDPQMRVRPKTQRERDVIALMRGGRSMDEAIAMLGGAREQEPAKDEPPIEAAFDKEISEIEKEIAALEKEQDAAAQEADVAKALKIARQITAKERAIEIKQGAKALALAQRQEAVTQTAADKEAQIAAEDHAAVIEDYPEIGDKKSPERKKFEDFIREKKLDPRYDGKFASLTWRSTLAHEFAAKNGIRPAALRTAFEPPAPAPKPAVVKPATTPPVVKPTTQATAAKTLTTKDSPSEQTFEITPEQAAKDFSKLTLAQQKEVMLELDRMSREKAGRRVA